MGIPISKKRSAGWMFQTPEAMQAWGRRFARCLKPSDTIALIGPLGAGKTTLVQSIAEAWGYPRRATSPTFALVNEYRTPKGNVYHMDMYRLTPKEISGFPLEEYLESGLCLIEWADRIQERLPTSTLSLHVRHATHDAREIRFHRPSAAWKKRLSSLTSSARS